ncbi:MAG: magnesium chelatase [Planctomycetes bacterium]|nr:magnesium chelatase [Planctomycetota bacterium]
MARPTTLGELRKAGYKPRLVKDELRDNLMERLRAKQPVFEGIVGYDATVLPQVINAILSRHNIILLGLRGQAKTRILRAMVGLLDEFIPVVAGSEINDDPFSPISKHARALVAGKGDATPIEWLGRESRYNEKLATPDVSIADLIGDVDPIKAASRKLTFADEEVIHFGIIPRTNRGIFAINELPDLQPRIQVGLLNILEEKDIQIRGFPVRIPLDIMLCFSANPEDYTNRGSIITPLKDRIESQVLTHYPISLDDARKITDQESWIKRGGPKVAIPQFIRDAIEQIAFEARKSEFVDQGSGVSARMTIAIYENVISNAERRCLLTGQDHTTARVLDLQSAVPSMSGKLELVYEGEQEGLQKVSTNLVGAAVRKTFERFFPGVYQPGKGAKAQGGGSGQRKQAASSAKAAPDSASGYKPIIDYFAVGRKLELTDDLSDKDFATRLEGVPGLRELASSHMKEAKGEELAVAMEFVLEGLHQSSLLAKEDLDRGILYCDMLGALYEG